MQGAKLTEEEELALALKASTDTLWRNRLLELPTHLSFLQGEQFWESRERLVGRFYGHCRAVGSYNLADPSICTTKNIEQMAPEVAMPPVLEEDEEEGVLVGAAMAPPLAIEVTEPSPFPSF